MGDAYGNPLDVHGLSKKVRSLKQMDLREKVNFSDKILNSTFDILV
ncbi:MAG: hypothetical protein V7K24_01360 [Nostoc sp.]